MAASAEQVAEAQQGWALLRAQKAERLKAQSGFKQEART
jgi:hypothetical protein